MAAHLEPAERLARLALARTETVGPIRFAELLDACGSAREALQRLPEFARRARLKPPRQVSHADVARELAAIEGFGGRLLVWGDADYPAQLAEIRDRPPVAAMIGQTDLLRRPMIAMVGSRNASAAGRRWAEDLARALGEQGFAVVSGMARGIDAAAHLGALDTGTVAVLAGGLDNVYPPENAKLYENVKRRGLLIAEQPFGLTPRAGHFPRRNRIVAGLALGVVVVEATLKSGALITARLAAEEGREVFAVPGSPRDPRARGPNHLIRQGAVLTESIDDILGALEQPHRSRLRFDLPVEGDVDEATDWAQNQTRDLDQEILECLSSTPIEVDEIVRRCQVTAAEAQTMLLELELAGRIERHSGNKFSLI
jgi:DNA processing protein